MLEFGLRLLTDRGLRRLGDASPPSTVIYSSPYPYGVLAAAHLAQRYSADLVFEVRDIWPASAIELAGASPLNPLISLAAYCETFAYRRSARVASLLPNAREHMVARGLHAAKFLYIPNGVHARQLADGADHEGAAVVTRAVELQAEGRFVVVYAGGMAHHHNLGRLLESAALLHARLPDRFHFLLVGDGDQLDALKKMATALGAANVEFFQPTAKGAILKLLDSADAGYVSVIPSPIYRFGISSNKMFDYMLSGVPIVSAIESPQDPVSEAGCGITVDPREPTLIADAIAHLAALPKEQRKGMGASGRRYVEAHHDYRVLAERYLQALRC